MVNKDILRQKHRQATKLLADYTLDLWLTFVRETSLQSDPALSLIYPFGLTWQSAFLFSATGERIAIVGDFDTDSVQHLGVFSKVIGYDESIQGALFGELQRLAPGRVAINTSRNDPAADGLTAAMSELLREHLNAAGIPAESIVSAESYLGSLRGRKTASEVEAIQRAIETTVSLYDEIEERIRPGISERELAAYLHARVDELGLDYAWDPSGDPIVNTGPESVIGHAAPSDLQVAPGHLIHFDFGIKQDGYCSDLQRMWYVLRESEAAPPPVVRKTWQAVRAALLAGAAALQPGARGWQVDAAARAALVEHGYPEYRHAFGHHLGRAAHDGATLLAPRWDRYGDLPNGVVEAGNVFAIELGAKAEGHGWVYLEENVRVTERGLEWLSPPQEQLRLVRI